MPQPAAGPEPTPAPVSGSLGRPARGDMPCVAHLLRLSRRRWADTGLHYSQFEEGDTEAWVLGEIPRGELRRQPLASDRLSVR